jgi:hypothetical protein
MSDTSSSKTLAPVAIFVYNRLDNVTQVIEALQRNILADQTDVFVFSDGAKNEQNKNKVEAVRTYLRTVTGFKSLTVIERQENYYIERNVTEGVTEIVNKFGKIIVMEDDGVTAKGFLTFMNNALDFYERYERVMHVATFTFIKMPEGFNKTFLWRYPESTGGGWATWKRAWDKFTWFQSEAEGLEGLSEAQKYRLEIDGTFKCLGSLKAKPIPWDICWYVAIIKNDGLSVNSPRPLIKNNGFFNGTHFNAINKLLGKSPFDVEISDAIENIAFEDRIEEDPQAFAKLKAFYATYGKRIRDRVLSGFLKVLVALKITKLVKKILRK